MAGRSEAGDARGPTPARVRPVLIRPGSRGDAGSARARFLANDAYRAGREWLRYEGTPQRDLFRQLRERFLARHAPRVEWAMDAGAGPGRFTAALGGPGSRHRVALDLGRAMLAEFRDRPGVGQGATDPTELVRGDAARSPFRDAAFGVVAALGNLVGFAGANEGRMLSELMRLVAPGGTLILEVAPGPGEHSRYLHRLPASSVRRLLRSPPRAVAGRIEREGFDAEPRRKKDDGEFRRISPGDLALELERQGFHVEERVAIAPALGSDRDRIAAVARDPKAWAHLLEVEEALGRSPDRSSLAAAVLLAAVAPPGGSPDRAGPKRRIK